MIPPRIRSFSTSTIEVVTGYSRTTLWRRKHHGRLGVDIIRFVQQDRAADGLPPLTPDVVETMLATLAAVEDARIAKAAEKTEIAA